MQRKTLKKKYANVYYYRTNLTGFRLFGLFGAKPVKAGFFFLVSHVIAF